MCFCSVMPRDWKINAKTALGLLSLFATVFAGVMPVEAVTQHQRAVVRASDGHDYEIEYTRPLNIADFYIQGLNGEVPSREVAAELYRAAGILNLSPIENPVDLGEYIDEVFTNTAKWKLIHEIAGVIGSAPYKALLAKLTGGTSAAEDIADVAALIGGVSYDAAVLVKARMVGDTFAERSEQFMEHYNTHWLWVEQGNATSIDNIKLAYLSYWKELHYRMLTVNVVTEHLFLPDWKIRVGNYLVNLVPFVDTVAFLGDAVLDAVQLSRLEKLLESAEEDTNSKASAEVNETFGQVAISNTISDLESAGFYDRQPPVVQPEVITEKWLTPDGDARHVDMTTTFSDPNGDPLTFKLTEGWDTTLVDIEWINLSVFGELEARRMLEITPKTRLGETSVTVVATDTSRLSVEQTFRVVVAPANTPPQISSPLPPQTLTLGSSSEPLDLTTYFHDLDSERIAAYTASSNNTAVATVHPPTGSVITISARGIGETTVTVTATDSEGLSSTQTFNVTVTADEPPDETPTQRPVPQGLNAGDSIIVQNTIGIGLNIRRDPSIPTDETDNKIGKAHDGATGTLVKGTDPDALGRTWWEIKWDASDKIQWQHQPVNNRGWSVEAIGTAGLLARRTPEPQPFDLEISLRASKTIVAPNESFTLYITIRNNGPGAATPTFTYYHSLTGHPQIQDTVSLKESLASGESTTHAILRAAPATPNTYYYGAFLVTNTGDTNFSNDHATEVNVTVSDTTIDDPVDTSDPPDLVITNISVDYDTMYPEERFTVSAIVENVGGKRASNVRLRFYRSSDATYSQDDVEFEDVSEFIGGLDAGIIEDEDAHFDAPSEPGDYYYIVRADPVRNEVDTDNNYAAIEITVLPPAAPDLVVSLTSNRFLVDPDESFRLDATVLNDGDEDSDYRTTVDFYRTLNGIRSSDDQKIGRGREDGIRSLREGREDDAFLWIRPPLQPGTYYYYACVDSVPDEQNTDNNCSNVITINVRGPDLIVNTVSVDYVSRYDAVIPGSSFRLEDVTVKNQGTDRAWEHGELIRYYVSSDATFSKETDTEVDTDRLIRSLKIQETSKTFKSENIPVPYPSGVFYCFVCVDAVEGESDTTNNCFGPIEIRVRNLAPRAQGTIPLQTLTLGTSTPLDVPGYFSDANEDTLTYTASSSNLNIVTVRVSGPHVTLTPQRVGTVNVTITASDGELTATQTFSVSVIEAKTPDLVVESVSVDKNTVDPGGTFQLSAVIKNQGEAASIATPLRYYLSTDTTISDTDTQVSDTILPMLAADAKGEPSVELTAPDTPGTYYYGTCVDPVEGESDATNNCSASVAVTVENRPPISVGTLPPRTLSENDAPITVDVAEYFTDPDNTALTYTADSDTLAVVMAAMRGSELTVTPVGAGNASVTVRASDGELTATQTLSVSVVAAPTENEAPVAVGVIPTQALTVDGAPSTVDISAYFSDANGDTLTYTAWPDDKNIVRLQRESTLLTITPKAAGRTTVTVRATDPDGLQASQRISVIVSTTEVPVPDEPDTDIDEPDPEIEAKVPDLIVESIRVNKTAVDPGAAFRMDAVIRNQGEGPSGDATVRFYQSADATITTEDTQVKRSALPSVDVGMTQDKWARLTAPTTAGVYYYGVCIGGVADESDPDNNCSTAIKITVGTVPAEPPTVETPAPTEPETGGDPPQAGPLAEQVLQKHGRILRRPDVKEVLPNVLTTLKEPDIQKLLNPATINLVIKDPDLLKTMVPTVSDKFIVLLKTDADIQTLLSDPQVQTLLQTPAAIDELAKLLGISNEIDLNAAAAPSAPVRVNETTLLPNYPNPFNPETWIPYQLATDTTVKITIYNTQGVVVRTLALGHQSAGDYTGRDRAAYWDGRNALGEQVASGVYLYQFETDDMSALRQMVILK